MTQNSHFPFIEIFNADRDHIIVVLNNSDEKQEASLKEDGTWDDRWNSGKASAAEGKLAVTLAPRGAAILVRAD